MEKYMLSKDNFALIRDIDFSEMGDKFRLLEKEQAIETADFRLMQVIINEEIVAKGMDEAQDKCTEFGRKLYGLYDELLYLKYERIAREGKD